MDSSSTPQRAPLDGTPPQRDAQDAVDRGAPPAGIADWRRYLAGAGEIQRTLVSDCDSCGATGDVHVIGRCGGVVASCADPRLCTRR